MYLNFIYLKGYQEPEKTVRIGPFETILVGRYVVSADGEEVARYEKSGGGWWYKDEWFHCFKVEAK